MYIICRVVPMKVKHLIIVVHHVHTCCSKNQRTYTLFRFLCSVWNNDWSFEVRCQHAASVTESEYRGSVLQRRLCGEESWIDSVKIIHTTINQQHNPAAMVAVKKWDGGRSLRAGVWDGLPSFEDPGCYPREFFWKYRCKSVLFGAFWGHQVMKSGKENTRFPAPS